MRFRRSILASLAPLIGLSALLAAVSVETGIPGRTRPLIKLLQSVVQFAAPATDYTTASTSQEHPSVHAFLAISALAVTPFRHALWMIASHRAVDLHTRRHLLVPLRC